MADKLKPFTAGELAKQAVKELVSGAFSSKSRGAAPRTGETIRERTRKAEGLMRDTNPYHSRQHTDDSNP